eukprot:NODE_2028_length_465_cov_6.872596_g1949_i0.p1 GENE.NODE_2028_length_465_cov_6.872596_g1949_i0~~NODE_2028_length_465_cov_6.872596_g1949_i0.p1  ORF type:complete len:118 (+),score=32.39 NODE_2028_length_465_cov_6.872596_g1949_i0:39-392(+)
MVWVSDSLSFHLFYFFCLASLFLYSATTERGKEKQKKLGNLTGSRSSGHAMLFFFFLLLFVFEWAPSCISLYLTPSSFSPSQRKALSNLCGKKKKKKLCLVHKCGVFPQFHLIVGGV